MLPRVSTVAFAILGAGHAADHPHHVRPPSTATTTAMLTAGQWGAVSWLVWAIPAGPTALRSVQRPELVGAASADGPNANHPDTAIDRP